MSGAKSPGSTSGGGGLPSRRKRLASKPPRQVPPEARSRAAERTLRLRGEVAIGRGALIAGALGLFLVGVLAGAAGTTWLDLERYIGPIGTGILATAEPTTPEPEPEDSIARAEPAAGLGPAERPPVQAAREPVPAEPVVAAAPPETVLADPTPPAAIEKETAAETPAEPPVQAQPEADADLLEAAEVATARVVQPPPDGGFEDAFDEVFETGTAESADDAPEVPAVSEPAPEPAPEPALEPVVAEAPEAAPAGPKIRPAPEEAVTLSALLPPEALPGPPPVKPEPPDTEDAAPSIFAAGPLPDLEPAEPSIAVAARETEEPAAPQAAVIEVETREEPVRLAALPPEPPSPDEAEPSGAVLDLERLETAATSPAWQRFAAAQGPGAASAPMVALVIDDLGLNGPNTRRALALPAPLTLAFLTYAPNLKRITAAARERGHELMVHLPMEPEDHRKDPGPKALLAEMGEPAIMERLTWALARFEGYVGLNNHMGSKFTASGPGMAVVLSELRRRGLLYLDSVTSPETVGGATAGQLGVPYVERDVFLDNEFDDPASIRRQLAQLEAIAREQGYAVGIGHPHRSTLSVLADWIPAAEARGLRLSPVSAIVRRRIEIAAGANGRAG